METDRWGGGSVLIWGGITFHSRTNLHVFDGNVNALKYRDEVLEGMVVPFMRDHPNIQVLQQDNARPHCARLSMDFLEVNQI